MLHLIVDFTREGGLAQSMAKNMRKMRFKIMGSYLETEAARNFRMLMYPQVKVQKTPWMPARIDRGPMLRDKKTEEEQAEEMAEEVKREEQKVAKVPRVLPGEHGSRLCTKMDSSMVSLNPIKVREIEKSKQSCAHSCCQRSLTPIQAQFLPSACSPVASLSYPMELHQNLFSHHTWVFH